MSLTKVSYSMIAGAPISVQDFGAVGDGVTDDTAAIQAAVDYAISTDVRYVFFPFSQKQRYRLTSTINIVSSGFELIGDANLRYDESGVYSGGYVFADSGVSVLFNYGNGQPVVPISQFVCEGMAFASALANANTQTAIKFSTDEDGPHRGFLLRKVSATGFLNVFLFDPPTSGIASAATVDVQSCVFRNNTYSVKANKIVYGFRFVGNQSEQTATLVGNLDTGVTITDNNLEGQSDPVNIDAAQPEVVLENNYMEAITGAYCFRIKGANAYASVTIRPNFITNLVATDIYRIEGVMRIFEFFESMNGNWGRRAQLALLSAAITPGSIISGKFYVDKSGQTKGFIAPQPLAGSYTQFAISNKTLGAVTLNTPFGQTTTGVTINGYPASFFSVTKTYSAGDILIATALVRVEGNGTETPRMSVTRNGVETGLSYTSPFAIPASMNGDWFIMFSVAEAVVSDGGFNTDFRFGSNGTSAGTTNLYVAAIGFDVVNSAAKEMINGVDRWFVRLSNPFV